MPKRGQHDQSTGDARAPFSNLGGPAGRHAQTHDVRREALTNPSGSAPDPEEESFDEIVANTSTAKHGGHSQESRSAADDKDLHARLDILDEDQLARLLILQPG